MIAFTASSIQAITPVKWPSPQPRITYSKKPPAEGFADIVSSVALTFFAFLGFGVITFTAKDLANPQRQLPRAVYLALAIASVVYLGVSIGVFGTLTVQEVIDSGGTALAVAAE